MSDVPQYSPSTVEIIDLVARLVRREEEGWVVFDARFRASVVAAARTAGLSEADAEDLYQELAVKLPTALAKYTPQPSGAGGFPSWLRTVARRMALDFLRRRDRAGCAPLPEEAIAADRVSTVVADRLDREFLAAAVDLHVRRQFREPWVIPAWRLFWLDDHTPEQIAARVGVSYAAAARALHRVRVYLGAVPEFVRLTTPPARPPE